MGNNRSTLVSGSTATTASLNSTSSLPVDSSLSTSHQPTLNLHAHSNGTQSSVSFLKRFRNPNPSSNNLDDLDHVDSNQRKKNKKLNTFTKKSKHGASNGVIDTVPDPSMKKGGTNRKKIDKTKIISLSASNIIKSSKVSTNESEYTSINEYLGDANGGKLINKNGKEESFYESTLDMDLANNKNLKTTGVSSKVPSKGLNKENELYNHDTRKSKAQAPPLQVNLDSNANLYSEIINKNLTSKTVSNMASDGLTAQPVLPLAPPPSHSKKNHLQPITNFFNKLTKTTKSPESVIDTNLKAPEVNQQARPTPAPVVPSKAFNPAKEFYNDLIPAIQSYDEYIEEEEDEDELGIYSKLEKTNNLKSNQNKPNLPPLPTTLVPSNNSSTEEIETTLSRQSDNNEYQSVQEYEFIKRPDGSPVSKTIPIYSPIEPLNINNQVYYSFTSDSQEKFDLQNEFISRIEVKCNNKTTDNKLHFKIDSNNPELIQPKEKTKDLNLINEIENSRNLIASSNHFTVKL